MAKPDFDQQISAIRAFNCFYTRKIGVLDGMASRPFALAEARVLYELAHREPLTATDIRKELGLVLRQNLAHLWNQSVNQPPTFEQSGKTLP